MTFFEAVEETGKARHEGWSVGWFKIKNDKIISDTGKTVNLEAWIDRFMNNDWLPYHEPKPCEACEFIKQFEGAGSNTLRAIKLLLKNPAVHDEGCEEKR